MKLWQSAPLPRPPAGQLMAMGLVLWLGPFLLGQALLALAQALPPGGPAALTGAIAGLLLFSPLFTWPAWLLVLPGAFALVRAGRFGWLPALALGLAGGALAYASLGAPVALAICPLATLALRALSTVVIPQAFATAKPSA